MSRANFAASKKTFFVSGFNLAVQSAHNPRESHGLASVADDEIFGRKRKLFFVQRDDFFALPRTAHDDLSAAELVRVKRVHRLAELEQDEIGDIHHGGNRAKPRQCQPFSHPRGRNAARHVFHIMPHVARAQVGRYHLDGDGRGIRLMLRIGAIGRLQRLFQRRRDLARPCRGYIDSRVGSP